MEIKERLVFSTQESPVVETLTRSDLGVIWTPKGKANHLIDSGQPQVSYHWSFSSLPFFNGTIIKIQANGH